MISAKTKTLNFFRRLFLYPVGESFILHLLEGARLDSFGARFLPNHYQYPKPSFRRVVRESISYDLDISDLVDWAIYFGLREAEQEVMFSSVHEGALVVDVGANIGSTVLRFCQAVGASGRVIAFEPDPTNLQRCLKNLALNEFSNHTVEGIGLGEKASVATLYQVNDRNPGMNRILSLPPGSAPGRQVRIETLDHYVSQHGIDRIDVIKIDVEGYETNVLRGATKSLSRFKPLLFLELCDDNLRGAGSSAQELLVFLEALGGQISEVKRGNRLRPVQCRSGLKTEIVCRFFAGENENTTFA